MADGEAVRGLEHSGCVTVTAATRGLSRRDLVGLGATGVAAGVLTMALPSAAVPSSSACRDVTGELVSVTPLFTPNRWRFRTTATFAPVGPGFTYYQVFQRPSEGERGDSIRAGSLTFGEDLVSGFHEAIIDGFDVFTRDWSWVVWVLYSDPGYNCEVGFYELDND